MQITFSLNKPSIEIFINTSNAFLVEKKITQSNIKRVKLHVDDCQRRLHNSDKSKSFGMESIWETEAVISNDILEAMERALIAVAI